MIPYLEEDFWKIFPTPPPRSFLASLRWQNQVIRLAAHDYGRRYGKKPAEYTAALKEQQRVDLERSLEFAKKQLGACVKSQA